MIARLIPSLLFATLSATAAPRVANTTITLPGEPPVSTIEFENAFGNLTFAAPLCLRSPAGDTQRLFICEKGGDLELIPDVTAASPTRTTFLDVDQILADRGLGETIQTDSEMGLLSVAFHPNYSDNGYFFTVYNVTLGSNDYQRLSRWHDPDITDTEADPDSEEILIEMLDDRTNHNGGDLHFGPDGYLYMSWGDEGAQNDSRNNSQFIDEDFWSSITRIDVDLEDEDYTPADGTGGDDANVRPNPHAAVKLYDGDPLYEVPADNRWVGATTFNGVSVVAGSVRSEFFAVGFRNPWRFSFDSLTGELWVGDVGQGTWEEVATVELGSNHGWAWFEGDANGPKFNSTINGASRTNATLTAPVWDYQHGNGEFQGNSVTGGFVYRGSNIPSLNGKYIFADYNSGNLWSLERNGVPGEPDVVRIAGNGGIAGFGPDPSNGDILAADINDGRIHRLVANDNPGGGFPSTLTATGIFSDLGDLTPNAGVIPYDVNLPFWSDYAIKQRWFAIKNTVDQVSYSEDDPWGLPNGMIFVKHFDLELERGNPATKKRIETRVLVRNQVAVADNTTLLTDGAACRVLVPADGSLGTTWKDETFDDASWDPAATGIGYDENSDYNSLFGTGGNLGDALNGENTSVYVRIPFEVTGAASIDQLTLRMKYDDGFVAFLNGVRVADANPPEDAVPSEPLNWESAASANNPDGSATSFEDFDLSAFTSSLHEGTNVLAIQGLNDGIGSSDMLVLPELVAGRLSFIPGSYGVSYKWNEAGTEADLVGNGGENIDLMIDTPGGSEVQTWNIPSRAACTICHNPEAGHALSFNTRQLNRDGEIGGTSGNFLTLLRDCNYLDTLPTTPAALPRHLGPAESDYSLEARARSYLAVNCAYCHQDPGTANASWLGNAHLTLDQTGMINAIAASGAQHPDDRLVVPENPDRSIILSRMAASNGYTRMPSLGTNELDLINILLITDWINQEASPLTNYTAWRIHHFGDDTSAEGEPGNDADGDSLSNDEEWHALTDPQDATDFFQANLRFDSSSLEIDLPGRPNRGVTVERSVDMLNWFRWDVPGNDGIPRNPATGDILLGTPAGQREFFRLLIGEP